MQFVHLPWPLRPMDTGLEKGNTVSIWTLTLVCLQPYMHWQLYCTTDPAVFIVEAILGQC